MKNDFGEGIVFRAEKDSGKIRRIFRVLESGTAKGAVYSLFVTTECGGELNECFAYAVSEDEFIAVNLCGYLCEMDVSAVNLQEVLNDMKSIDRIF